jgi:hypothetical protein
LPFPFSFLVGTSFPELKNFLSSASSGSLKTSLGSGRFSLLRSEDKNLETLDVLERNSLELGRALLGIPIGAPFTPLAVKLLSCSISAFDLELYQH